MEHFEIGKIVMAAIGAAVITTGCTACGLTTGGGLVLGTTGFLQEANRARHAASAPESVSDDDRDQLAGLVRRSAAGR